MSVSGAGEGAARGLLGPCLSLARPCWPPSHGQGGWCGRLFPSLVTAPRGWRSLWLRLGSRAVSVSLGGGQDWVLCWAQTASARPWGIWEPKAMVWPRDTCGLSLQAPVCHCESRLRQNARCQTEPVHYHQVSRRGVGDLRVRAGGCLGDLGARPALHLGGRSASLGGLPAHVLLRRAGVRVTPTLPFAGPAGRAVLGKPRPRSWSFATWPPGTRSGVAHGR